MKTALLSDDILLVSGQHLDARVLSEMREGTPYLTGPTDFTDGRPTATRWTKAGRAFCKKGDVLVVVKGSGTGASFISDARYAIGRQLMAIRPQEWVTGFVRQILSANSIRYQSLATGLIPGIGRFDILNTPVVSLRPNEQQKIADILGTWDEGLDKLDALIAAKVRRKQSLMQQLLTDQNGRSAAWHTLAMETVLKRVFRPMKFDAAAKLELVSIRRRCGGLFHRPEILAADYKTQDLHALKTGDFLISKRQVAHGAWSIVEPEFDGTLVSKEYAILVNRDPKKLNMRFFAWLAQTPRMIHWSRVSSTGVHIEKLIFDPDVFLRGEIRIPTDLKAQAAITTILDTADAELRLLRQQRAAFDQQKRGLMQQLLSGCIRVSF